MSSTADLYIKQEQGVEKAATDNKDARGNLVPVDAAGTDTNVFYLEVRVYLEGVQVPHNSASVSYGIGAPPTCTIVLPASNFLRSLPGNTKVLITHRDLLADATGEYRWRVIFDGELSDMTYNIAPEGAYITLQAIHTSAYLTLMQIMNLSAAEYLFDKTHKPLGNTTFITMAGNDLVAVDIIQKILERKQYQSMADLTYIMIKNILEGYKDTCANSKWYWEKLGSDPLGYKIPDRIYGVSDMARSAQVLPANISGGNVTFEEQAASTAAKASHYTAGSTYTSKMSNGGSIDYTVYTVDGLVGTGGDSEVGALMVEAAYKHVAAGTQYQLGATGVKSTDCGQFVKQCLDYAGIETTARYVPDMIQEARDKRIWVEADGSYEPKAGDGIVVEGDGHIVFSDGKGGYWGMSSSKNGVDHNNNVAAAFGYKITGYIKYSELAN